MEEVEQDEVVSNADKRHKLKVLIHRYAFAYESVDHNEPDRSVRDARMKALANADREVQAYVGELLP